MDSVESQAPFSMVVPYIRKPFKSIYVRVSEAGRNTEQRISLCNLGRVSQWAAQVRVIPPKIFESALNRPVKEKETSRMKQNKTSTEMTEDSTSRKHQNEVAIIGNKHENKQNSNKYNVLTNRKTASRKMVKVSRKIPKGYPCRLCPQVLSRLNGLRRHMNLVHKKLHHSECTKCEDKFRLRSQLQKHMRVKHGEHICYPCSLTFGNEEDWTVHRRTYHRRNSAKKELEKLKRAEMEDLKRSLEMMNDEKTAELQWSNEELITVENLKKLLKMRNNEKTELQRSNEELLTENKNIRTLNEQILKMDECYKLENFILKQQILSIGRLAHCLIWNNKTPLQMNTEESGNIAGFTEQ